MSEIKISTVFDEFSGKAKNYRIPSMVVTKSGVLVAAADARYFSGGDNPNRIDKVVRRSLDSGETWQDMATVVEEVGDCKENASAAIDPVMVYVEEINRIIMIYSHTPAGIGILNANRSVGEDENGNVFLHSGKKRYIAKDGKIFTKSGDLTEYTVNDNGDYFLKDKKIGNYNVNGLFKQEETFYLKSIYSDDDGATWSKPYSLNHIIKKPYMSFIGAGPGCGIVLQNGKHKGRVLMPIYFGTRKFSLSLSCVMLYSDDNGRNWKMGVSPNDTRKNMFGITRRVRLITNNKMLTESQAIELDDGTVRLYMRNHELRRRVAVAESYDGGVTFENFRFMEQLPQPICQQSVIRFKKDCKPYVVFVNAASEKKRENGVVRLSLDDGLTFPYSRQLKDGEFVYSSTALLPDGKIGVLFEGETTHTKIDFAKFPIEWITEKE